jgi:ribokinase
MNPAKPLGVAVIGSITADVTAFSTRLPKPGETVLGQDATLVLGGKGANQALAAARAGAPTWMIGCVGDDLFADLTLTGLKDSGVDVEFVRSVSGPTGLAHIRVDVATGQNDIVMTPLANDYLDADYAESCLGALHGRVGVLLLQLETPVETMVRVVAKAHTMGITVILDPAPARPLPDAIWPQLDIVTPNETEAALLTGIEVTEFDSAAKAAWALIDKGVKTVIVTMAGAGALVATTTATGTDATMVPPFAVHPIDTTAAGDAFTGVLGQSLAAGLPMADALVRASAAGAIATTVLGASPSLPTAAHIDAFVAANRQQNRRDEEDA